MTLARPALTFTFLCALSALLALSALSAPTAASATEDAQGVYAPKHKRSHMSESWLERLPPEKRARAEQILMDAKPRLRELRGQLYSKMREIKTFSYDHTTSPDLLPRLGQELQVLRNALYAELRILDARLADEVGITLSRHSGRGCAGLSRQENAP